MRRLQPIQRLAGILAGQVGAATSPGIVENVRVSGTICLTSGTGAAAWDNGQAGGICARLHGADSKIYQCTSATDITAVWCGRRYLWGNERRSNDLSMLFHCR